MTAVLAPHVIPYHGSWHEECRRYNAGITKVVDPDKGWCIAHKDVTGNRIIARLFTTVFVPGFDDPAKKALEHLNMFLSHPAYGIVDFWETANEPNTNDKPDKVEAIARYLESMLRGANERGIKLVWGNFGVGHPVGSSSNPMPNWSPFWGCFDLAGQTHPLGLHEYWPKSGPDDGWGWYAGRFTHLLRTCPIIITECGLNDELSFHDGHERGWRSSVAEVTYKDQLDEYLTRLRSDSRVISAHIFTLDYGTNTWAGFDVRGFADYIGSLNSNPSLQPLPLPQPSQPTPTPQPNLDTIKTLLVSAQDKINQALNLLKS